jgi:hypothetical protein
VKVGYVAGKFAGANGWEVTKNVRHAEEVGYEVAKLGAMPLIPHANTASFHGTLQDSFWYAGTLELLRRCDFIVMVPGWQKSNGAKAEWEEALTLSMPMFEAHRVPSGSWVINSVNGDLKDWLKENT